MGFEMGRKGLADFGERSELVACLEEKLTVVRDFLSITESLRDQVQTGDLSTVMGLLARRQELIDRIDRIEEKVKKIGPESPCWEPGDRVDSISKTVREMLEKAVVHDKACMDKIISWQDEVRGELSGMKNGLKAVQGYTGRPTQPPKFLDTRR
jgi:hypothetical protein